MAKKQEMKKDESGSDASETVESGSERMPETELKKPNRRGHNVDEARIRAIEVIKAKKAERDAAAKMKKEVQDMKKQVERELLEAERRQAEAALKQVSKLKKKIVVESDSESESEEEQVVVRRKKSKPVAVPKRVVEKPTSSRDDLLMAEQRRRIDALRQSMYNQLFH